MSSGAVSYGKAWFGRHGMVVSGEVRYVAERQGMARFGRYTQTIFKRKEKQ